MPLPKFLDKNSQAEPSNSIKEAESQKESIPPPPSYHN